MRFGTFFALGCGGCLLHGVCWAQTTTTTTPRAQPPVPAINTDHRFFADELTNELYGESSNENDFTSTWSISLALGLLYPAAKGASLEQLETVVRLPPPPPPDNSTKGLVWKATTTRLQSSYDGSCQSGNSYTNPETNKEEYQCYDQNPDLIVSYQLFVDNSTTLEPAYAAIVGNYVESIDLQGRDAGGIINAWVNASTMGRISSIVSEGPQEQGMDAFILNAVYLKAKWRDPFDPRHTNQDVFFKDPSRSTDAVASETAQFMHDVRYNQLYSDTAVPGYQLLRLFFQGGSGNGRGGSDGLSVILALPIPNNSTTTTTSGALPIPNNSTTITSGAENDYNNNPLLVSSVEVLAALPSLERRRVAIALPKFQFETEYQDVLKTSLEQIGLVEPFDEFCDSLCVFEGTDCRAYISKIAHKTFVDWNEDGVEAAAATLLGITMTSMPLPETPVLFQADHPFQLFIYDAQEELVLFEGLVADPVLPNDSPPPQLEASHQQGSDFWQQQFGVSSVTVPAPPAEPLSPPPPEEEIPAGTEDGSALIAEQNDTAAATFTFATTTDAPIEVAVERSSTAAAANTSAADTTPITTTDAPIGVVDGDEPSENGESSATGMKVTTVVSSSQRQNRIARWGTMVVLLGGGAFAVAF